VSDTIDTSELYSEHKAELPEEWHETFDQLTAQGNSPSGIKATIEYATSGKTQQEVSHEYGVSKVTIRNLQAAVVALGPIDHLQGAKHSGSTRTSADYCSHIADVLGWSEGDEYNMSTGTYGKSQQPALRKEGWKALYEFVTGEHNDET